MPGKISHNRHAACANGLGLLRNVFCKGPYTDVHGEYHRCCDTDAQAEREREAFLAQRAQQALQQAAAAERDRAAEEAAAAQHAADLARMRQVCDGLLGALSLFVCCSTLTPLLRMYHCLHHVPF